MASLMNDLFMRQLTIKAELTYILAEWVSFRMKWRKLTTTEDLLKSAVSIECARWHVIELGVCHATKWPHSKQEVAMLCSPMMAPVPTKTWTSLAWVANWALSLFCQVDDAAFSFMAQWQLGKRSAASNRACTLNLISHFGSIIFSSWSCSNVHIDSQVASLRVVVVI